MPSISDYFTLACLLCYFDLPLSLTTASRNLLDFTTPNPICLYPSVGPIPTFDSSRCLPSLFVTFRHLSMLLTTPSHLSPQLHPWRRRLRLDTGLVSSARFRLRFCTAFLRRSFSVFDCKFAHSLAAFNWESLLGTFVLDPCFILGPSSRAARFISRRMGCSKPLNFGNSQQARRLTSFLFGRKGSAHAKALRMNR